MNCTETEKLIYRQDELSHSEKKSLIIHLDECETCRALHAEYALSARIISRASEFQPASVDANRLTDKVMSQVFPAPDKKSVNGILLQRWIRYTFASVSLCIVLLFYAEWQSGEYHQFGSEEIAHPTPKEASLVSPSLRQLKENKSRDEFSLYEKINDTKQRSN